MLIMVEGLVRCQSRGDAHFMTLSCFRRQAHLGVPETRSLFERSLETMSGRYNFYVFGYVVKPEHIHLLVTEPKKSL
jgi:putative transposase